MLVAAPQIARRGHAERGGERRARMAGAVAIVLAFGAEQEAVEAVGLADGVEAVAASGKKLVDIGLVADVEDEIVRRRVEDAMKRDGQLDHAQIRPEMAARLGQNGDEFLAYFLGQDGEFVQREFFDVCRGIDRIEKACHKVRGEELARSRAVRQELLLGFDDQFALPDLDRFDLPHEILGIRIVLQHLVDRWIDFALERLYRFLGHIPITDSHALEPEIEAFVG